MHKQSNILTMINHISNVIVKRYHEACNVFRCSRFELYESKITRIYNIMRSLWIITRIRDFTVGKNKHIIGYYTYIYNDFHVQAFGCRVQMVWPIRVNPIKSGKDHFQVLAVKIMHLDVKGRTSWLSLLFTSTCKLKNLTCK